jgi:hypothetical protein
MVVRLPTTKRLKRHKDRMSPSRFHIAKVRNIKELLTSEAGIDDFVYDVSECLGANSHVTQLPIFLTTDERLSLERNTNTTSFLGSAHAKVPVKPEWPKLC